MPELPEVETTCRQLRSLVIGKKIHSIEVYLKKAFISDSEYPYSDALVGEQIVGVRRRGKYIILDLSSRFSVVVHLRMTGALYYIDSVEGISHLRVAIVFGDKTFLVFKDIRTFGMMTLMPSAAVESCASIMKLGPEPLMDNFTTDYLYRKTRNRRIAIKSWLLNQEMVAGIGNIYADEALFAAGIKPFKIAGRITRKEAKKLVEAVNEVISLGISNGGTTFRDYQNGRGERGNNIVALKVYGRASKPCLVCGCQLDKKKIGGRTSVYCSQCQE